MPIRYGAARAQDVGISQFANNGTLWMAGTGKVDVANNNYLKCTVALAAEAPRPINIIRCGLIATGAVFTHFFANPTTGLPTTVRTPSNAIMDGRSYAGRVTCKADASGTVMGGGTPVTAVVGNGSAGRVVIDGPFILRPGHMIGFDTYASGAYSIAFNIYWVEA